jgi:heparosan-N-sulfate-glucuronate 5-epimerase
VSLRYMIAYAEKHIPARGPLDEQGIPLFDPKSLRLDARPLYHPIVIIQYGLAHYDLALDGDSEAHEIFLDCARWLEEHASEDPVGRFVVWLYEFPLRTPPVRPPWISGMAQGQALSLLTRAFLETQSTSTAEVARRAARSFCYSIREGGVVSESKSGALFIEEVAHLPELHILNGCLYGLFGLYEYLQVFDDAELQPVFERCLQGVDEVLPLFDMGWWSRYSLGVRWHVAPRYYHDIHIRQLKYLAVLLNRPEFDLYAQRWEAYRESPILRLRHTVRSAVEVNVNRVLTVARLDRIKYRPVPGLRAE